MRIDYTVQLAKMMKTPEDALRAARLSQDKVNDIYRRARAATWQCRIFGLLSLALFIGAFVLAGYDHSMRLNRLIGLTAIASFVSFAAYGFTKSPSKITVEATTAMQRRLVEIDRYCQN
jgi:hypothetical protein